MRLIDPIKLKSSIALANILEENKTLEQIIDEQPTVTERTETLLDDGTLLLECNTDISKVKRVLLSENGTHWGELYYPDEDDPTDFCGNAEKKN